MAPPREAPHRSDFWLHGSGVLLSILLAAAAFGPAVSGPFFFDDEHFIVRNQALSSLSQIPTLFRTSVTENAYIQGNFYRPLQQTVYAFIHACCGQNPVFYHAVPILLHTVNSWLLVSWMILLGFLPVVAWIGGLLYLVHPVQTEAVAYISGLADPLATFFLLLGLRIFSGALHTSLKTKNELRETRLSPTKGIFITALCLILALLSKENAVVFFPCAVLTGTYFFWSGKRPPPKRLFIAWGLYGVMTLIYLSLKFSVFNFTKTIGLTSDINPYTESLTLRLNTFLHVLWDYGKLIVVPVDLYYEKPYTAYSGWQTGRASFGLFCLAVSTVCLVRARAWPQLALGVGIFWTTLMPFTGVIPMNAIFLEHWLYVPLVGMTMVFGFVATKLWQWAQGHPWMKPTILIAVPLVLTLMTIRAHGRSMEWADPERFYLNEIAHGGRSTRTFSNLGLYYADHGQGDKAAFYWQQAIASAKSLPAPEPHHNLARYYLEKGDLEQGLKHLHEALKINPLFVYSLDTLRQVFEALRDNHRSAYVASTLAKALKGEAYDFTTFEAEVFTP